MSQRMKQNDPSLDEIIAEIRRESVEVQTVEHAAQRVWARIREHYTAPAMATGSNVEKIRGCADFQALLPAYLDRNVSAARTMLLEDHLHGCVACRHVLEEARRGNPQRAPRVPLRPRPFWLGALGGMGAALAAALALFFLSPSLPNPVLDDLVTAHVRSLMPEHLTDVVLTDRHTVKPWFAGHADVSPVVADFAERGYRLIGGRADYFDQQRVAVVVYQHGAHVINVFTWVAGRRALPESATRRGYHIACWKLGNLQYCAVSDTGWDELQGLVRLLRAAGELDTRANPGGE